MNGNNDIDDLLKLSSLQNVEIPEKINKTIDETLKKCKRKKPNFVLYFGRIIATIATGLTIAAGGIGVFALMGGEISGRPVQEFLGIKTPNIDEYKEKVEGQEISYKDTKVDLVSTVCSEGITILEFDVKLSDEDRDKLLLGQSSIRQEDYENFENSKEGIREAVEREVKSNKIQEMVIANGGWNQDFENIEVLPEEVEPIYQERLQHYEEILKQKEETEYVVGLALNTNQVIGKYTPDRFNPDLDLYGSIYIDDQGYYVPNWQKCEKVNNSEYKVYQMYLLTDNELQGKDEFKITLKNNKLTNITRAYTWEGEEWNWRNDAQWFGNFSENGDEWYEEKRTNVLELEGDFEVEVSKKKVMENSTILENIDSKSEFRNITISVDKVTVTPIQTIIQITHSATNQTTSQIRNREDGIEWMPITNYFKIYDENGNELDNIVLSNWHTLIYQDGTTRTYDSHDIPQDNITNATYETVEYIIIENTDSSKVTIVPTEEVHDLIDGVDPEHVDMDPIEIDLK